MINIVHCKKSPYTLYIGRKNGNLPESKWANSFIIGQDGDREEVILKYRLKINSQPELIGGMIKKKKIGIEFLKN